jgi:hypothetical protein
MLQTLIQETLEREFTQFLGAAPFERSAASRALRNGRRRRRFLSDTPDPSDGAVGVIGYVHAPGALAIDQPAALHRSGDVVIPIADARGAFYDAWCPGTASNCAPQGSKTSLTRHPESEPAPLADRALDTQIAA